MTKASQYAATLIIAASFFITPLSVFAKTASPTAVTEQKATPTATMEALGETSADIDVKKVEYMLPYPGILPDHPLYFLKMFRDQLLDRLIVDPVRKAEFYILQADKRLNMGIFLMNKQAQTLAEETISKGEKYLNNAVFGLIAQKGTGKDIPTYVVDRLEKSIAKHIEVLEELMAKAAEAQRAGLSGSLELVRTLQGEVGKLK